MPGAWAAIATRNVPLVQALTAAERDELFGHVRVFLADKRFDGCGGLEIDDEVRVTIATQACLLLLNREVDAPYPDLEVVAVYPSAYVARRRSALAGGAELDAEEARLGQSQDGVVVLAWDASKAGAADTDDGRNVVLHEFAHQLDQADGAADGAPELGDAGRYSAWARVLGAEYEALHRAAGSGRSHVLDGYGATNPAEFFAVATETFFERPAALRRRHPELYAELCTFYRRDPLRTST